MRTGAAMRGVMMLSSAMLGVMTLSLMTLSGCARLPRSDAQLATRAHQAVDSALGAQATFSEMEIVVAQQIACGHASAAGAAGQAPVEQDFVYRSGRLILDGDPDFDAAAIQCDEAAAGDNTQTASDNAT